MILKMAFVSVIEITSKIATQTKVFLIFFFCYIYAVFLKVLFPKSSM